MVAGLPARCLPLLGLDLNNKLGRPADPAAADQQSVGAIHAGREGSAFCSAERHPLARLLAEAARQDASTAKAKRDAALERLSAAQAEIDDKGGLLADVEQQITDLEGTVQQTAQVTRAVLLLAY